MITLFEDDQPAVTSPISEVFDFTELEDVPGEVDNICVVKFLESADEPSSEQFEDCFEVDPGLSCSIPDGVSWVSMDMQDIAEVFVDVHRVSTVRSQAVVMTLDSGGDVSVVPEEFAALGSPGGGQFLKMVDAQGERIATSGNRKLQVVATTRQGEKIEFVENFAVGAVSHPLMSFGKFLRQGWNVGREGGEMFIHHPSGAAVPIRLERNSLVMDV